VNSVGRYTPLTAYLSQWSQSSRGDRPKSLALTSVPVLLLEFTADASTFPSDTALWSEAAKTRLTHHKLTGANHYLAGQPLLVEAASDRIAAWLEGL